MALNRARVLYYDSSVEGPNIDTSPFWKIVAVQGALIWPIRIAAISTLLLIVIGVVNIMRRIARSL